MKKWSFQKVHNEKVHFQKAECLVKAVKKSFYRLFYYGPNKSLSNVKR